MFDPEFYPTPEDVILQMQIDCRNKIVLEPSAGKGDIVKWLQLNGAKKVIACEKHPELKKILATICHIIADDFFTVKPENVSHVNQIIMNPPFSNADKHILHAWEIAPEGCEIISLFNYNTLESYHFNRELKQIINTYGSAECIGSRFKNAERVTDVEIGLIRIFKPITSSQFDFDSFYLIEDEPELNTSGIMPYNDIKAIVNSYISAVKCFDQLNEIQNSLNNIISGIGLNRKTEISVGYRETVVTKEDFARWMQMECWKLVFDKLGVEKYVTKGVMNDINRFTHRQLNYPFSMRNIYRMLEIIIGTREHTMKRAIIEAVDNFTRHTHENRYGVEGWKTNDGHLLNTKFICTYISTVNFIGRLTLRYDGGFNKIIDLTKALCYLTGKNFDEIGTNINGQYYASIDLTPGQWYTYGFFDFKIFKKGSGHFKFRDIKHWEILNRAYAKAKGQTLPEKL